jgi:hypothetical protein
MSGDAKRNDEPDFLDDDFVVEDLAGKNDDLEQLFEDPAAANPRAAQAGAAPDSDDVLFTDHSADVKASEQFAPGSAFAEDGKSTWQGDQLELDSDRPAKSGKQKLAAAEAAFTEELGGMLQNDEDLSLDSEKELELVDQPSADEVKEFEQSGAFVLEEGDGAWREQNAAAAAQQPAVEPEVAEGIWEAVKDPAMAEHADEEAVEATQEPGWEQLPEANVDELSEVDGVEEAVEQVPTEGELAAVEGHDIYGEDAPVLVGARASRRRSFVLVAAMAASLALVSGAAVLVMRPEWVGLQLEGERVQQVMVDRPRVEVAVVAPPAVPDAPRVAVADPNAPHDPGTDPQNVAAHDPVATAPTDPAHAVTGTDPALADPAATTPDTLHAIPGAVAAVDPASPVASWPAPLPAPGPKPLAPNGSSRNGKSNRLVRISDNTMLGTGEAERTARPSVVEGMMPGTRAFAQLYNGNYFIGSVKAANADTVTLRLPEGEVTLTAAEILHITPLGSADYEALQRVTSGFVRLTNNNRLVGNILSQIADDHIVLEFRSNRVMLPKSAIGGVVEGADQPVRLDVTPQENDWVRNLAERQLGSQAPGPSAPSPNALPSPVDPGSKQGASAATPTPPRPANTPMPAPAPKRTPAAPPRQR